MTMVAVITVAKEEFLKIALPPCQVLLPKTHMGFTYMMSACDRTGSVPPLLDFGRLAMQAQGFHGPIGQERGIDHVAILARRLEEEGVRRAPSK